MKKLLYTLLIGLMVISCDKNEESLVEAPVLEQEILLDSEKTDLILDYLLSNLESLKDQGQGQNLSDKGSDYISVNIFTQGDFTYLALLDESNDDLCFGDLTISTIFFDNSAGDGSVLTVEDSNEMVLANVGGDFSNFFSLGQNSITKLSFATNGDLVVGNSGTFDDSNSATIAE